MSTVREFIRANFDKNQIIIPWKLHTTIRIKDVAFMSLHDKKFKLDDKYYDYIEIETSCEDTTCPDLDTLSILKPFNNTKNVCLAMLTLSCPCHEYVSTYRFLDNPNNSYCRGVYPEPDENRFLKKAWNYAVKHDLAGKLFGRTILKLDYEPKVDTKSFIRNYLETDDQAGIREFIKANFDKKTIVIPWELHDMIQIEDVAFISLSDKFKFDRQYRQYIGSDSEEDDNCYEGDTFYVTKLFENTENVCLAMLMVYDGCHYDAYCEYELEGVKSRRVFDDEYLGQAWDYAVKHNLISEQFGHIILKLRYEPEVDVESFTRHYLGGIPTKSARTLAGVHTGAQAGARTAE